MERKILRARTVLQGDGLEPLHDGGIVVEDGKIALVAPFASIETGDAVVTDLGTRTLLPGMIECHNHAALDARLPLHLEMMNDSECALTVTAVKALEDDLMSGVTTARCMGDRHYIDCVLRDKVRGGVLPGPELLASGIGMRGLHGHGFVGVAHTGPEEFRRTARENLARGAALLKIFATSGMPPVDGGFVPGFLSREEIGIVVEEGARLNIPTAAHCIGGRALRDCVEMGVEVIEHAYAATEEDLELIQKHGCWVDLTSGIFMDESREPFLSEKSAANTRRCRAGVIRSLEMLVKGGVKFTLGTDAYHTFLYREVEYAVQLGADTRTALQGVTSNAAKICRLEGRTGSLRAGLAADIIAVDGDPLSDPHCLSKVGFVMKGGTVWKASA